MIECPDCEEISLPEEGGECEACGITAYFEGDDQDIIDDDNAQRVDDMNAALRGGW
jgi:hypothetical protein